jgi:hypothetical protein
MLGCATIAFIERYTTYLEDPGKGEFHPITCQEGREMEVWLYSLFNPGCRLTWVVNATPQSLYSRERPGVRYTGGWVVTTDSLDDCGKSRLHRDSIPGPSSP